MSWEGRKLRVFTERSFPFICIAHYPANMRLPSNVDNSFDYATAQSQILSFSICSTRIHQHIVFWCSICRMNIAREMYKPYVTVLVGECASDLG